VHDVTIVKIGGAQPVFSVRAIVNGFEPPPPFFFFSTAASTLRTMHTWVYCSWCLFSSEWRLKQASRHVLVTGLMVVERTAQVNRA